MRFFAKVYSKTALDKIIHYSKIYHIDTINYDCRDFVLVYLYSIDVDDSKVELKTQADLFCSFLELAINSDNYIARYTYAGTIRYIPRECLTDYSITYGEEIFLFIEKGYTDDDE